MKLVKMIRVCSLLVVAMVAVAFASNAEAGRFGDRLRGRGGDCCAPVCCEPVCCEPVCCEDPCDRGGLFSRLRNKHRGGCCEPVCCEPVCCEPAPCPEPCAAPCEPAPCCDPCDPCCEREGFLKRLRNKHRRGGDCCDPCAPSCGC